jgi:hypothetical protein
LKQIGPEPSVERNLSQVGDAKEFGRGFGTSQQQRPVLQDRAFAAPLRTTGDLDSS